MAKHLRPVSPTWGSALRKAMKSSRDLKRQTALARKSGVSQATVGRILRGEVNPAADHLQRLAKALRIPIETLFDVALAEDSDQKPSEPKAALVVNEILRRFEPEIAAIVRRAETEIADLIRQAEPAIAQWRKEEGL